MFSLAILLFVTRTTAAIKATKEPIAINSVVPKPPVVGKTVPL